MAVKMRLRREGKRKQPFYRVVVANARSPRDGRFIEDIGYYQPLREPSEIDIKRERALYWLREGVQPSDAVRQLLRVSGIWEEFRPGDVGRQRATATPSSAGGAASPDDSAGGAASPDDSADGDAPPATTAAGEDDGPAAAQADATPPERDEGTESEGDGAASS